MLQRAASELCLVTLAISLKNWLHRCASCEVALCLIWCPNIIALKFLIISSLILCFVSQAQWNNGAWAWVEERYAYTCFPSHATPFAYGIHDAPCTQNSSGSMACERSVRRKASTKKVCSIYNWVKPKIISNAERRQWHSKKHKWPRNSIISFLISLD